MTVTFFGHSDTPQNIGDRLYQVLKRLICDENADVFYIGNHGNFDCLALSALERLKRYYPHIQYIVVLAYMPCGAQKNFNGAETVLPVEVASAPPRFAPDRRNGWMLDQSDVVITYVTRSCGGAAKFKKRALSGGKRVIEVSQ